MQRSNPTRTLYVVAYDIPNDRRRTKVHKLLRGFGDWTQFSLFECYLSAKEMVQLRNKLDKLVKAETDSVRFYPLCAACVARVDTVGSPKPAEAKIYVV